MSANDISNRITWRELLSNPMFRKIYNMYVDENPTGGGLHIVLSDYNNDDDSIVWCMEKSIAEKDYITAYIAKNLLMVNMVDRNKHKWFIPDDFVEW